MNLTTKAMRGIIFSTESVQAILEGRKSQTRREVKETPDCEIMAYNGRWICNIRTAADDYSTHYIKPRYQVGEIVYVKETWTKTMVRDEEGWFYVYKADGDDWAAPFKSPLFMPQSAARIFIQITDVRVERLGDISEEDAIAEGLKDPFDYQLPDFYEQYDLQINQCAYIGLWQSINKSYNPDTWVWAYSFKRIYKLNN